MVELSSLDLFKSRETIPLADKAMSARSNNSKNDVEGDRVSAGVGIRPLPCGVWRKKGRRSCRHCGKGEDDEGPSLDG